MSERSDARLRGCVEMSPGAVVTSRVGRRLWPMRRDGRRRTRPKRSDRQAEAMRRPARSSDDDRPMWAMQQRPPWGVNQGRRFSISSSRISPSCRSSSTPSSTARTRACASIAGEESIRTTRRPLPEQPGSRHGRCQPQARPVARPYGQALRRTGRQRRRQSTGRRIRSAQASYQLDMRSSEGGSAAAPFTDVP